MRINYPVRMAILDMNNNSENMGIASIKRIADRFAIIDYEVFDVRHKKEVPGLILIYTFHPVALETPSNLKADGKKNILALWIGYGNTILQMKLKSMCSLFVIHFR